MLNLKQGALFLDKKSDPVRFCIFMEIDNHNSFALDDTNFNWIIFFDIENQRFDELTQGVFLSDIEEGMIEIVTRE